MVKGNKVYLQNTKRTNVYEDKDKSVKGKTDTLNELHCKRQKCPTNDLVDA